MKRTKRNITMTTLLPTMMLLAAVFVFSACSNDDTTPTPNNAPDSEISFNPEVWKMLEGTRATTFDGTSDLQSEGFMCGVYNANEVTEYISPVEVNWGGDSWAFSDGKHFWPASGSLDFFAYSPTTPPSYISGPTYTTARTPQFTCTGLPMTYNSASPTAGQGTGLKEFVYAMALGQNKTDNISGVNLVFQHPFARIKFQLSALHPNITINSITLKSLKSGGSCSFNGTTSTWSSLTPEGTVDFVATLDQSLTTSGSVQAIGTDYIMVPQGWGGEIVVNATWTDWGAQLPHTVSTTLPSDSRTWVAGRSYTYTFTITETDLIVNTEKFTEQW